MITRKRISPEFLPLVESALRAYAYEIARRQDGGLVLATIAARHVHKEADSVGNLIDLQDMVGGEIHLVAFDSLSSALINEAVAFHAPPFVLANESFTAEWQANAWTTPEWSK